ncbi:uncharacterized protein [Aphelocoma coerulescens]|uniref:uncharacterized protein isoform X4 n=1 Tax=Aphelocoma coerulescens TaxID=39617 RepID=UPI0036049DE1
MEHRGLPVLVKSLWRSTQKSCHPKSRLANSLRRSCLEISFWQLDEKGVPWPRRDYQGSSCIPREHELCVSPLHQNCVGGNQELSRSFFISTHFQGGSSQAKTSAQGRGFCWKCLRHSRNAAGARPSLFVQQKFSRSTGPGPFCALHVLPVGFIPPSFLCPRIFFFPTPFFTSPLCFNRCLVGSREEPAKRGEL